MASVVVFLINSLTSNPNHQPAVPLTEILTCDSPTVIDGDSLKARCANHVIEIRLAHIDAPELKQLPWGILAKQHLEKQLPESFQLTLSGKDVYQRYLGTIGLPQKNINLAMLSAGFAVVYPRYQPPPEYVTAMHQARSLQRGIWASSGLQQDPQRWRRLMQ